MLVTHAIKPDRQKRSWKAHEWSGSYIS